MTDAPNVSATDAVAPPTLAGIRTTAEIERAAIAILLTHGFPAQRIIALRQQEPLGGQAHKIMSRARRDAAAAIASLKRPTNGLLDEMIGEFSAEWGVAPDIVQQRNAACRILRAAVKHALGETEAPTEGEKADDEG